VTGAMWSEDLGWTIAAILLAGLLAGIITVEIHERGRLLRAVGGYLIARRHIAEWRARR
jgi:hypothetical protein